MDGQPENEDQRNREHWATETAKRLLREHGRSAPKKWRSLKGLPPETDLAIWLRDNCRCVYCDRDMLRDYGITYCLYSYDHLLPVGNGKYSDFATSTWNKVLACRACNSWKGQFDPAGGGEIPAAEDSRDRLIERARTYIEERRKEDHALFLKEREILRDALMLRKSD